ncbi:hypothetical protein ACFVRD_33130 [Streptomyces sp. NPDC057908]|uniref:hypothetical protein n=1 Tax=Streptomyces sp. NPDC057908 TaxID=3346276 RepID=UPI0036E656D7
MPLCSTDSPSAPGPPREQRAAHPLTPVASGARSHDGSGVTTIHHKKSEITMAESTTMKHSVTVGFGSIELTGSLHHDDENRSLVLETDEGPEHISVNLKSYGITPEPGNVFTKDWSEHAGLTARLEQAGLVKLVHELTVGPFGSTACEVEVTL